MTGENGKRPARLPIRSREGEAPAEPSGPCSAVGSAGASPSHHEYLGGVEPAASSYLVSGKKRNWRGSSFVLRRAILEAERGTAEFGPDFLSDCRCSFVYAVERSSEDIQASKTWSVRGAFAAILHRPFCRACHSGTVDFPCPSRFESGCCGADQGGVLCASSYCRLNPSPGAG